MDIVETLKKRKIKPYFEDNDFVLYLADSLKLLPKIPKESFDMIFSEMA